MERSNLKPYCICKNYIPGHKRSYHRIANESKSASYYSEKKRKLEGTRSAPDECLTDSCDCSTASRSDPLVTQTDSFSSCKVEPERLRTLEDDLEKIRSQLTNLNKSKCLALNFTTELQTRYKELLRTNEDQSKEIENLKNQNKKLMVQAKGRGDIVNEIRNVDKNLNYYGESLGNLHKEFSSNVAEAMSQKCVCDIDSKISSIRSCDCNEDRPRLTSEKRSNEDRRSLHSNRSRRSEEEIYDRRSVRSERSNRSRRSEDELYDRLKNKNNQVNELERCYHRAKESEKRYQDEIEILSITVKKIQQKLEEAIADNENYRGENENVKKELTVANEKCQIYMTQLEEKCCEVRKLSNFCMEMTDQCKSLVAQIEEKCRQIQQLRKENQDSVEQCKCYAKCLEEKCREVDELSRKYLEVNEQCKLLCNQLDRKCAELNQLKNQHEKNNKQCCCVQSDLDTKIHEIKCLHLKINELKCEMCRSLQRREETEAKYQHLLNQYKALEMKYKVTEEHLKIRSEIEMTQPCANLANPPSSCKTSCSAPCGSRSRGESKSHSKTSTLRNSSELKKTRSPSESSRALQSSTLSIKRPERSQEIGKLREKSSSGTKRVPRSTSKQSRSMPNQSKSSAPSKTSNHSKKESSSRELKVTTQNFEIKSAHDAGMIRQTSPVKLQFCVPANKLVDSEVQASYVKSLETMHPSAKIGLVACKNGENLKTTRSAAVATRSEKKSTACECAEDFGEPEVCGCDRDEPEKGETMQWTQQPTGKKSPCCCDVSPSEDSLDSIENLQQIIENMYQEIEQVLQREKKHEAESCKEENCVECNLFSKQDELVSVKEELQALRHQFNNTLIEKQSLAKNLMKLEAQQTMPLEVCYDANFELECVCEAIED